MQRRYNISIPRNTMSDWMEIGDDSFQGILHSDGYSAHNKWANDHDGVIQAGCWAHVRRKFFDSLKEAPECAAKILRLIQELSRKITFPLPSLIALALQTLRITTTNY